MLDLSVITIMIFSLFPILKKIAQNAYFFIYYILYHERPYLVGFLNEERIYNNYRLCFIVAKEGEKYG